jgi:hypothetical protein
MSEFLATAERLRTVKNAVREFIELWAIDALMEEHASSDRIAGDILRAADNIDSAENIGANNLSFLYQGRRLDD